MGPVKGRVPRALRDGKRPGLRLLCGAAAAALALMLELLPLIRREAPVTLSLALYPYVPDQARFQRAVEAEWRLRHPEVKLDFVAWDCYDRDPPEDLDVFVYDSIFLYDFLDRGCLLPLAETDIRDPEDLIPCALSACRARGSLYAVPQLLCTNLLFAREGDEAVAGAEDLEALYGLLGDCSDASVPPPEGEGLLVGIDDRTTLAFWYLETRIDQSRRYSPWDTLPGGEGLDPETMETLEAVQAMAGSEQMTYVSPDADVYIRGAWFAQGRGRALIGFSEALWAMGEAADAVTFHRISLSEGEDIPMLYADIASVNARIDEKKKPLALELLNIITSRPALTRAFSGDGQNQASQYLLSARWSVYDDLSASDPLYGALKDVVADPDCRVFLLKRGGRAFQERARALFRLPLPRGEAYDLSPAG